MRHAMKWMGIGAAVGAAAGVVETYLLIWLAALPGQTFTAWSVLHLLLTAAVLNGLGFWVLAAAAWAALRFLPGGRRRTDQALRALFAVLAARIVLSGYVSPLFFSAGEVGGRILANGVFFLVAIALWVAAWRSFGLSRKNLRRSGLGVGVGVLLAGALGVLPFPEVGAHPRGQAWRKADPDLAGAPHVILILVDTLRSDHLSSYGYPRPTSPVLDAIAKEGILFEESRSHANWTIPSTATLLTSLHETVTGMHHVADRLPDSAETLAEVLRKKGYTTAFFSTNIFVSRAQNYTQGFDHVLQLTDLWTEFHYRNNQPPQQLYIWRMAYGKLSAVDRFLGRVNLGLEAWLNESGSDASGAFRMPETRVAENRVTKADWMFRHVRAHLESMFSQGYDPQRNKLFLYLHYFDPHDPYRPPGKYKWMFDPDFQGSPVADPPGENDPPLPPRLLQNMIAQYDGEIRFFDDWLGVLVGYLKARGLYENSLLILTSDHGEAFFEHGTYKHGYTVYEEEVRVPLVMRHPGKIPAGVRNWDLVGLADVMPTILDFLGIQGPPGMQGNSLLPLVRGNRGNRLSRDFYGETSGLITGSYQFVVSGEKKHIARFGTTLRAQETPLPFQWGGLFDLRSDPRERKNLLRPEDPETVRMRNLLKTKREEVLRRGRLKGGGRIQFDPRTLERLRSLGYIAD